MTPARIRHLIAVSMDDRPTVPKGWTQSESKRELEFLVVNGFLAVHTCDPGYILTEKGEVFVKAITEVPDPVQSWRIPT